MTPTPPPPPDIVTLAIAVASAIFGANAGAAVGAYSVIILFAVGGAAWSAAARPESTRLGAFWHGVFMVLVALGVTVPISEALFKFAGLESRWTLGPIAAVVAARPEWVIDQLKALWFRRSSQPSNGGQE